MRNIAAEFHLSDLVDQTNYRDRAAGLCLEPFKKTKFFSEDRLTATERVAAMYDDGAHGRFLYWLMSGYAHSDAVVARESYGEKRPGRLPGTGQVEIAFTGADLQLLASALTVAQADVLNGFGNYMGWDFSSLNSDFQNLKVLTSRFRSAET